MNTTFADQARVDPRRDQVEEAIRRLVVDLVTLPCHVVRRTAERIAGPVGVARSLVSLTAGGLVDRFGSSAPAPAAPPVTTAHLAPQPGAGSPVVAGDHGRPPAPPGELPIEDYESLAASQVVARLGRLDESELRQVAAFELANRGRRTVLGKIEQLLGR